MLPITDGLGKMRTPIMEQPGAAGYLPKANITRLNLDGNGHIELSPVSVSLDRYPAFRSLTPQRLRTSMSFRRELAMSTDVA